MISSQTPQQWKVKGEKEYQKKAFLDAEIAFQQAADGFRAVGDKLTAAEMDNNRSVCLLQADKPEMALQVLADTPDIFAKVGDQHRQAMALGNQAAALAALKRFDEAEEKYQQSSTILKDIGDTELRTDVMKSLSALQLKRGQQLDALLSMHIGLQQTEKPNLRQRFLKKLLEIPFNIMGRK
ncbi:MAG: tetratricopeptide repeat protein [Anaerolineales bacterium]|nr:tetratricopeptide repeat protein [Anaerolineales bacterium]